MYIKLLINAESPFITQRKKKKEKKVSTTEKVTQILEMKTERRSHISHNHLAVSPFLSQGFVFSSHLALLQNTGYFGYK